MLALRSLSGRPHLLSFDLNAVNLRWVLVLCDAVSTLFVRWLCIVYTSPTRKSVLWFRAWLWRISSKLIVNTAQVKCERHCAADLRIPVYCILNRHRNILDVNHVNCDVWTTKSWLDDERMYCDWQWRFYRGHGSQNFGSWFPVFVVLKCGDTADIRNLMISAYRKVLQATYMVGWFWWDASLISTTNWFPSVLWHCWFGHLACKNRPQNDL